MNWLVGWLGDDEDDKLNQVCNCVLGVELKETTPDGSCHDFLIMIILIVC
jgi:hypothetical protein